MTHPVLFKRGFGISLNESLNAAEYLASEGNARVIFDVFFVVHGAETGEDMKGVLVEVDAVIIKTNGPPLVLMAAQNAVGVGDRSMPVFSRH